IGTSTYPESGPEMLAQSIRHGAQGLEDIGVVRLAADDEKDVCLPQPMVEADARYLLHLVVGWVAAEIGRDDRIIAEQLGDERVGAAAEGRSEDGPGRVDHIYVALTLIGSQFVDLLLEGRIVDGEEMGRQIEALPARIVAVEAAFEVAGDGGETAAPVGAHADRVQLERRHAEVVEELPQLRQHLHERRNDGLR